MMRTIENLVFEGGGVLGIAYAGAITVLEEQGIFSKIKGAAGTSAGSLAACMTSLNYTASEITEVMQNTNFKDFEDHWDPLRIVSKYGLYKGQFLLEFVQHIVEQKTGSKNTTYQELHDKGYKTLKVYSCDLNETNIKEFSYKKTPKVQVAESVRASMSIPLFFEAWQFTDAIPDNHLYVDGGTVYNYPINAFGGFSNVLGLAFAMQENTKSSNLKYDHMVSYVEAVFHALLKSQKINIERSKEEEAISVMIDTLGISATNFKLSDQQKKALFNSGKKATENYLGIKTA